MPEQATTASTLTARCPVCGMPLHCHDCEDQAPTAGDLWEGWRLRSPLGRWETVTDVGGSKYRLAVYTDLSGGHPWTYWPDTKVAAHPPEEARAGEPEVRLLEGRDRDGMMWLAATRTSDDYPDVSGMTELAHALYDRPGRCWKVTHRRVDGELADSTVESKAKARAELKRLGQEYAKRLGVGFRAPTRP